MSYPDAVEITEVGMRDGFQMERHIVSTSDKISVGLALIAAGVRRIEAASFVSPSAVPQLADAQEVVAALKGQGATIAALVPNQRGALRAAAAHVDQMVVFISASESHNQANVRRSIAQSLEPLAEIAAIASGENIALCGAVATSFGCPFEGEVDPSQVLRVIERFVRQGIDRVSLGDTTGMATPPIIRRLCQSIAREFPQLQVALHFHNTRGLGLVNVVTGLELGITRFESSFGGLGGCPFAVGATGNVCTEDLVYLMDELGIASGIGLGGMIEIAQSIQTILGHDLPGQVMKAGPRLRTPRTIG